MKKGRAATAALTAAMAAAPIAAANGDEYQFIDPATYPAANVSYPSASEPTALVPGAIVATADASGTDLRSGTSDASEGIALRSDKALAIMIVVR